MIAEEMNNDFVSLLAAVLESHVSSCVPCKWKAILFRISTPVHRHIFVAFVEMYSHFVNSGSQLTVSDQQNGNVYFQDAM